MYNRQVIGTQKELTTHERDNFENSSESKGPYSGVLFSRFTIETPLILRVSL